MNNFRYRNSINFLLVKISLFISLSEKNSLFFIKEFFIFELLSFPIISFFNLFFMSFNSIMFLFVKPFIFKISIVFFVEFIEFSGKKMLSKFFEIRFGRFF